MFVAPNWIEGWLIQFGIFVVLPLIIAVITGLIVKRKRGSKGLGIVSVGLSFALLLIIMMPIGNVFWHYSYEVPSVQEKIITVQEWQPRPGINYDNQGTMVIDNAGQLMLITTENEGFLNDENFLFQKFNTRDIFNDLKINGTYKIKYYGWRNGFNSGFPNILSVEKVINETGTENNRYGEYFGVKFAR
ncbi:DUF1523 family protein [Methanobrevibacter filiformis]|uniref:Uncharacterized protein n=1 Tax=Methanobrevibacter filiformis TaxID=55758 RepID=A0A166F0A7_9EURY|nr:DUF1523 family protein [Methanobrevibacter filiformis]KZX17192.1 hypothetical protein MBFIL_03040 [Methanobrevibacter filiformis]